MDLLTNHFIKTLIAIVAILLTDLIIEFFILKRISNKRKRDKAKVITRNIIVILFLFLLVKIWVEGFIQILALLGLIAAGLTITQKENILNLTGGLIIMWRAAFAEGDYITIAHHSGIIKNLGIFYFTIDEVVQGTINERTGRTIKIPNSFVSLNAFTVYQFDSFVLVDKSYYFSFKTELDKLEMGLEQLKEKAQAFVKSFQSTFSGDETKEYKKLLQKGRYTEINCFLNIEQNANKGYRVRIIGHCPLKQEVAFNQFLDNAIIEMSKSKQISLLEG